MTPRYPVSSHSPASAPLCPSWSALEGIRRSLSAFSPPKLPGPRLAGTLSSPPPTCTASRGFSDHDSSRPEAPFQQHQTASKAALLQLPSHALRRTTPLGRCRDRFVPAHHRQWHGPDWRSDALIRGSLPHLPTCDERGAPTLFLVPGNGHFCQP
jgi:hypothetical protein